MLRSKFSEHTNYINNKEEQKHVHELLKLNVPNMVNTLEFFPNQPGCFTSNCLSRSLEISGIDTKSFPTMTYSSLPGDLNKSTPVSQIIKQ